LQRQDKTTGTGGNSNGGIVVIIVIGVSSR